ncbi:hypothetical protein V2J09_021621 [Rumex salicifolius]
MASPEPEFLVTGESPAGVAMLIPLFDEALSLEEEEDEDSYYSSSSSSSSSRCPCKMPEKLRRRLVEWKSRTSPISVEDIEAKLRDADHRRQVFRDQLSKKASPKRGNLLQTGSSNKELERRIGARLLAAERKRQSNLAKLLIRLAKLDELRQAAKARVEILQEKERKELRKRVEFRFQKAEANRILILKKDKLRRASLRERRSQSKLRRMARENKYKERVSASISQKRAAAEKKRLGLLETEKRRAHARFLQVQQTAQSVSLQREVERRKLRDQMEYRLQRAKTQRAEYLRQRGKKSLTQEQEDALSRMLARCWRHFLPHRTTFALAKAFDDLQINENRVRLMPFEQLAHSIESRATLQAVKPLLDRLERRIRLSIIFCSENDLYKFSDIDHLLKKVAAPKRKVAQKSSSRRNRGVQKVGTSKDATKVSENLQRYPVRLVLCAYMIITHPDAVFSGRGERELELANSATEFVKEFELLIKIILNGPMTVFEGSSSRRLTFRSQLAAFDSAWCIYLNNFVVWKVRDAESLEQDLVRAACQLELSMMQKCKLNPEGESVDLTEDLKAIKKQVVDDQKLLREKVLRLSGAAGIRRLEQALSDSRSQYFQEKKGSTSGSPTTPFLLPASPVSSFTPPSAPVERCDVGESRGRPKNVVRSLFGEGSSRSPNGFGSSGEKVATQNEMIVNEFLHTQSFSSADSSASNDDEINSVKGKIRETMEKAFWDGILESLKQATPNYGRLIELIAEVRDELSKISPESWKEEIYVVINVEGLSKMLSAGNLDMDHLHNILKFALITMQKLSAPANDNKIRQENEKLLKELTLVCQVNGETDQMRVIAVVKGLRFVLEQIQGLKRDISTTHIRLAETLLNGSAGVEYLQTAFLERYGPPAGAVIHLPSTLEWISSVRRVRDHEFEDHINSFRSLTTAPQESFPSLTLRTGRNTLLERNTNPAQQTSSEQPECQGEMIDSLVRIGVLKLVTRIPGLTMDDLPETLRLNHSRLLKIQAQVQKVTVLLTSSLVVRQIILSKAIPTIYSLDIEKLLPRLADQLSSTLDSIQEAGINEIIDVMGEFLKEEMKCENGVSLQSAKELIARMLVKSLQSGDSVFDKVSGAFYRAARGIVLGGSGARARELAKIELQKMGAGFMADRVVDVVAPLVVVATASVSVHGAWYANIVENGR